MLLQSLLVLVLTPGLADDKAALIVGTRTHSLVEDGKTTTMTTIFSKDGKLKLSSVRDKKEESVEGTYKIENDKLTITLVVNGKTDSETNPIKELTKGKMVLLEGKKEIVLTRKK